jgi:protease-4
MGLLPKRKRIAVVELHGTIGGSIKSPVYERIFSSIRKDRTTRALVLDIDSPGGGVPASDLLYRSVSKIAEEKQVVASIRGIGASGAYMMACAAHKIVANPGSLVGSIGVISIRPVLQELLGRLGVGVNVNKSGNLKDMGAFWRDATPEETRKMQALIDDSFDVFVDVVAKARRMEEARVREVATGEVYWAPKAQELGLVDELGDLDRAIDLAAELSGAPRRPVCVRRRRGIRERIFGPLAETMVESVVAQAERRLWMEYLRY